MVDIRGTPSVPVGSCVRHNRRDRRLARRRAVRIRAPVLPYHLHRTDVTTVCSAPALTDVLPALLPVLILLLPDVSEISLGGFALKRAVDRAQTDAAEAREEAQIASERSPITRDLLPTQDGQPALRLYDAIPDGSRSRELLELFARNEALLRPAEIAPHLPPNEDGTSLTTAQARGVINALGRLETRLITTGVLDRRVLLKDFTDYDAEGAGRYGISPMDRVALRDHLEAR